MTFEIKLFTYYIITNALVYILIKIDKQRATSHKRRIPENTLWLFSVLGGCFGLYFGIYAFHHKTKKLQFRIGAPLLCLLHSILVIMMFLYL